MYKTLLEHVQQQLALVGVTHPPTVIEHYLRAACWDGLGLPSMAPPTSDSPPFGCQSPTQLEPTVPTH
jgi:hypothetical protein